MKVSLILTLYGDRREQFPRSLPFFLNQTYDNYEVIVVDDGSLGELPLLGNVKYIKLRSYTPTFRNFWATMTPWGFPNFKAPTYANHFGFCSSTRERFEEYMIPDTEIWGHDDSYVHAKELENGEPSLPIDVEIYHQSHNRLVPTAPEYSTQIYRGGKYEYLPQFQHCQNHNSHNKNLFVPRIHPLCFAPPLFQRTYNRIYDGLSHR